MTGDRALRRESFRLLVVGPDGDTAPTLRTLMRSREDEPSTVDWTTDRGEALRALEQRGYDVCVLDGGPTIAGEESFLAGATGAGCPVVVLLPGNRSAEVERAAVAAGAADFIWKEELAAPLLLGALRHALDVRDRMRLQRQLHLAQRMETVGQLAGGIAHEFNNILTAIIGFGGLLAEHLAADEAAAPQVREILAGAQRASMLTRDLLAFSRRQVLRPAWIDPKEVVEHLARMLGGVIGSPIALKVRCADRVSAIHADRAQLEQAITTLAITARASMPRGGELTIELDEVTLDSAYCDTHISARPGRHVRLAITDTGQGIPRDLLPRVFEPFSTAGSPDGTPGLGLSTVYGIVKQTGGNIWVYSEPGVGTTFKLYFPTDDAGAADPPPASAAGRGTLSGSETILLVDDTDVVRRLARDVLSTAGYRVLEASGADEALVVAGAQPAIDLLVTDVVMPGRSGIELVERLRSASFDLRVLYTSGYTDEAVARTGLLADEETFLQKPFTPEDLLRKVRQVLEPR
jgi:two-component system, cell cycle sensor histidine kinase and response regulator CckA